ncbi:holo-ACP synthase [Nitrosopumilus sp.]|uniref:holo-ACP synthase n=1 Tax=Nitrosopumilus sp. TaxID=2024843 RepID=UPI003D0CBFA7
MLEKIGSGIDIVDVTRFRELPFQSNKKFYEKIFTNSEIKYCLKFQDSYSHFAGKFALKEALMKSINIKEDFLKIETSHSKSKPSIRLKNENNKNFIFVASISHEKNYAIGMILSEQL